MLTQRFLVGLFPGSTDVTDDQDTYGTCNDINGEHHRYGFGVFLTGSSSEGSLLNYGSLDHWIGFQAALAALISMISDGSASLNRMI